MYGAAFIFALLLMLSGATLDNVRTAMVQSTRANIAFNADQLPAYGLYVERYAQLNPSITGEVAAASVGFPTWMKPAPYFHNYVAAGRAWVYFTPDATAKAFAISKYIRFTERGQAARVGVVVGGKVKYPAAGLPTLAVPTAIPEGALVIVM